MVDQSALFEALKRVAESSVAAMFAGVDGNLPVLVATAEGALSDWQDVVRLAVAIRDQAPEPARLEARLVEAAKGQVKPETQQAYGGGTDWERGETVGCDDFDWLDDRPNESQPEPQAKPEPDPPADPPKPTSTLTDEELLSLVRNAGRVTAPQLLPHADGLALAYIEARLIHISASGALDIDKSAAEWVYSVAENGGETQ